MKIRYSRSRSYLRAVSSIYEREIQSRQLLNRYLTFFVAVLFLILKGGNVMAGGLVDTSVERFQASDFANSANITNPWWTLPAGDNFLYFAQDGEDCVWDLTEVQKATTSNFAGVYSGTSARIVLDRSWVDEGCAYGSRGDVQDFQAFITSKPKPEPEESTYDWYAQDSEKNIWYMGEDTFNGVDSAGSFVAGCQGAEAGIVLLGNPSIGDFYQQEFYEGEAEDWGKVVNFAENDGRVCMKTKEWTPLEAGDIEHKWYCSNGMAGELSLIEELHSKTLIVKLVGRNIKKTPPATGLPISPIPNCS
jgi:hypothetical protein